MTLEELKERRAGVVAAQQQMVANVNALAGQVALLDEMIATEEAKPKKGTK